MSKLLETMPHQGEKRERELEELIKKLEELDIEKLQPDILAKIKECKEKIKSVKNSINYSNYSNYSSKSDYKNSVVPDYHDYESLEKVIEDMRDLLKALKDKKYFDAAKKAIKVLEGLGKISKNTIITK